MDEIELHVVLWTDAQHAQGMMVQRRGEVLQPGRRPGVGVGTVAAVAVHSNTAHGQYAEEAIIILCAHSRPWHKEHGGRVIRCNMDSDHAS